MKLIIIQNYLLLIDEKAEIKAGDIAVHDFGMGYDLEIPCDADNLRSNTRHKVAAYYPLTKEAKELDLPLLPNPFVEAEVEELALNESLKNINEEIKDQKVRWFYQRGFVKGYKASQAKQLELLKRAIQLASDAENIEEVTEEIIQSLSTQQLPKEFIPEYETLYEKNREFYGSGIFNKSFKTLKTLINSEGKEELVGTYKY